jgi:hypothetical protein
MIKAVKIGGIVVLAAAIAVSAALVGAQMAAAKGPNGNPGGGNPPYGPGQGQGTGWMAAYHDLIHAEIAKALGLTADELTAKVATGTSAWEIAQAQGMTLDEFRQVMLDARAKALDQAVKDGVITQAQADAFKTHQGPMMGGGKGPGKGPGAGQGAGPFNGNCPYATGS